MKWALLSLLSIFFLLLAGCGELAPEDEDEDDDDDEIIRSVDDSSDNTYSRTESRGGGPGEYVTFKMLAPLLTIESPTQGNKAGTVITPSTVFGLKSNGDVIQFDLDTQTETRHAATGQVFIAGTPSPGNGFLYLLATYPQGGTAYSPSVQIFDLTTFQLAGSIALPTTTIVRSLALSPDGEFLYVAGNHASQSASDPSAVMCHILEVASRSVVNTLRIAGVGPIRPEIVASGDGTRVYLTAPGGVAAIDTLTQTVSHIIAESGAHIAIHPDGATLYVAPVFSSGARGIAVVDLGTSTRVKFVPVDHLSTMSMTVTASGKQLVIDQIVPDPVTNRNDYPVVRWFDLPEVRLTKTNPWTTSREIPVTTGVLTPLRRPRW